MVGLFHFKWNVQNSNSIAISIFVLYDFHLWNKDDLSLAMFLEKMLVLVKEMVVILERCMCSHLLLGKIIFFTCPPLKKLLVLPKEMVVLLERCMCSCVLLSKIVFFFKEIHLLLGENAYVPKGDASTHWGNVCLPQAVPKGDVCVLGNSICAP